MKRDKDLLRKMLLILEERFPMWGRCVSDTFFFDVKEDGAEYLYKIELHFKLLVDAKYIDGKIVYNHLGERLYGIDRITQSGYEILDAIRDDEIWQKVNEQAEKVGGAPMEILAELARQEIYNRIDREQTDVYF